MKKLFYLFVLFQLLVACSNHDNDLVIACGWEEVFISDIGYEVPQKLWSWTADSSENMPSSLRNKFLTTDECKPVNGSKDILVTSSGGGVAVVNIDTKEISFWASVPNAHSAEMLPGKIIAVAASLSPQGNRIYFYRYDEPGIAFMSDSLYSAHGLLWDEGSKMLWALGYDILRSYRLYDWQSEDCSVKMANEYRLPGIDGHDLQFAPGRNKLMITTTDNVWIFDMKKSVFLPHPVMGNESNVKSVSYNKRTDRTAYVKASEENWWGYYIHIAETGKVIYLPYEKLYKVRWLNE